MGRDSGRVIWIPQPQDELHGAVNGLPGLIIYLNNISFTSVNTKWFWTTLPYSRRVDKAHIEPVVSRDRGARDPKTHRVLNCVVGYFALYSFLQTEASVLDPILRPKANCANNCRGPGQSVAGGNLNRSSTPCHRVTFVGQKTKDFKPHNPNYFVSLLTCPDGCVAPWLSSGVVLLITMKRHLTKTQYLAIWK